MGRLFAGMVEKSKCEVVANVAKAANQRPPGGLASQHSQDSREVARQCRAPSQIRNIRGIRNGGDVEKSRPRQGSDGRVTDLRKRLLALAEAQVIDAAFVDSMTFDDLALCVDESDERLVELLRARVRDGTSLPADPFGNEAIGLPMSLGWMPATATPTRSGNYVVQLMGARFPVCAGWVNEVHGWRRGAMRVQVEAWMGPLPEFSGQT